MENLDFLNGCNTLNDICRKLFNKANCTNREKVKKILYENGIDWKEWLSKKKEENANYCAVCGKKLKRGQEKFCSHSCSAKYNNGLRKEATYCKNCGKKLRKHQKNFCSHGCQHDYEYKEFIKRWKNGEEKGMNGKYGLSHNIKRYMLEKTNCSCEICGCNWVNPKSGKPIVEIHHIDGDYTNNREENLQVLCPNHHAMTDTFKNNNECGRKKRNEKNN